MADSINNKSGILLDTPFKFVSQQPLDVRYTLTTAQRSSLINDGGCYAGLEVWDTDENIKYRAVPSGGSFVWKVVGTDESVVQGYVQGPPSSKDGEIAIYDGTSGKVIGNSGKTIDDLRKEWNSVPDGYYWADLKLQKEPNDKTIPTFNNNFKVKVPAWTPDVAARENPVIQPTADMGWASPIAKYFWHNLLAFDTYGEAEVEIKQNGVWYERNTDHELRRNPFIEKENMATNVIQLTANNKEQRDGTRWTWITSMHCCAFEWLVMAFTWNGTEAKKHIKLECWTDKEGTQGYRNLCDIVYDGNSKPIWIKIPDYSSGLNRLMLTIERDESDDKHSVASLTTIKLLTARWGNQGLGSEIEKPYQWDYHANLLPKHSGESSLGTSSKRWHDIHSSYLHVTSGAYITSGSLDVSNGNITAKNGNITSKGLTASGNLNVGGTATVTDDIKSKANITAEGKISGNNITATNNVTAASLIKKDGTNEQILLADGSVKLVSDFQPSGGYQPSGNYVTYEKVSSSILGVNKTVYKYGQSPIFTPSGLIMGGTAQEAGLVTRGICGVTTPRPESGNCAKENLYINYDGTHDDYKPDRQVIIQAGLPGKHYGNNLYQYAAARGDAVKNWVEAQGFLKNSDLPKIPDITTSITQAPEKTDAGIEVVESIAVDTTNKHQLNIKKVKVTAKDLGISTIYTFKGNITWAELLLLTNVKVGETYNVTDKDPGGDTNSNWVCIKEITDVAIDATKYAEYWDDLGGDIDLSSYATKEELKDYVTLATDQTITGAKTFSEDAVFNKNITAESILKNGGTATQVLMADGTTTSVSEPQANETTTNNYNVKKNSSGDLYVNVPWVNPDGAYLPLAGGQMSGPITLGVGDGRGLIIPLNKDGLPDGTINVKGTSATVLGFYGGTYRLGYRTYNTNIRGKNIEIGENGVSADIHIHGLNLDIKNGNAGVYLRSVATHTDYTELATNKGRALFLQPNSNGPVHIGSGPSTTGAQDSSAALIVAGDTKASKFIKQGEGEPERKVLMADGNVSTVVVANKPTDKVYNVAKHEDGSLYVNVPWQDTHPAVGYWANLSVQESPLDNTEPHFGKVTATGYVVDSAPANHVVMADGETRAWPTIPTPSDYYWANLRVSSTSSTETEPTFKTATADSFKGSFLTKYHAEPSNLSEFTPTEGMRIDTRVESTSENLFPTSSNANTVLTTRDHNGDYYSQLGFSSNGNIYFRHVEGVKIGTQAWNKIAFSSELNNFVTIDTDQTITGQKTFSKAVKITDNASIAYNSTEHCVEIIVK